MKEAGSVPHRVGQCGPQGNQACALRHSPLRRGGREAGDGEVGGGRVCMMQGKMLQSKSPVILRINDPTQQSETWW